MINNIGLKLEQGKYQDVEDICKEMNAFEIRDIFMSIAYETESINVYGFMAHMSRKQENIEWLKLAVDIMLNPLCFIEGAYSIALFHARELLSIDRNVENLERILFFYNIPERLIDEDEARCIAEELLAIELDNKVAFQIINGRG